MSSYRAWRGAVEVAGFNVNVALYSRVKKTRNKSFRNLAPSGQPVQTQSIDPATGQTFDKDLIEKGVETSKGVFSVISAEAIETINSGVKTEVIEAAQFSPVDTIAWDLAIDRFAVREDPDVAGSLPNVNVLWNGLKDTGLAYVAQVSLSGGHDAILAIYADDVGLWAALLPFEAELYDVPAHSFTESAKAGNTFAAVIDEDERIGAFDHAAYTSEYRTRREAAIEAAIEGKSPAKAAPKPKPAAPDLLDALEKSLAKKGKAKRPSKPKGKVAA